MTSSDRSGLTGRALAATRRGARHVRWARVVPVVLILGTVAALGLSWSLDHGPSPVATDRGRLPSYDAGESASPRSGVRWSGTKESGDPVRTGHGHASSDPRHRAKAPTDLRPPTSSPTPVPQSVDPAAIPSIPGCLVPRRFSVLTFNIHGGRTDHGVDLPAVAAEIRAARADIVLLQEVDRNLARTGFRDEPRVLADELGMHAYFSASVRSNAILTRFPVTEWSSTRLPLWSGREERRLVHATVLVDGQAVNVFTTHLDQSYAELRVEQIRAAEELMTPYADEPTILGGDLNSPAAGAVLGSLRDRLRDSWLEVGTGPGNTVPARNPRIRIDYLLHNSWLSPRAAQVLPSRASDHRSLRVVFDLWGRRGCGS